MRTEYAVFRKVGGWTPLGGFTFSSYAEAANFMQQHADWADWLEVHEREVTDWKVSV